jgi:hypothetical protein
VITIRYWDADGAEHVARFAREYDATWFEIGLDCEGLSHVRA